MSNIELFCSSLMYIRIYSHIGGMHCRFQGLVHFENNTGLCLNGWQIGSSQQQQTCVSAVAASVPAIEEDSMAVGIRAAKEGDHQDSKLHQPSDFDDLAEPGKVAKNTEKGDHDIQHDFIRANSRLLLMKLARRAWFCPPSKLHQSHRVAPSPPKFSCLKPATVKVLGKVFRKVGLKKPAKKPLRRAWSGSGYRQYNHVNVKPKITITVVA